MRMKAETKGRAKAKRDGRMLRNVGLEALAELPPQDNLRRMIDEALHVAKERQQLLMEIREALDRDKVDDDMIVQLVRRYCGLTRSLKVIR